MAEVDIDTSVNSVGRISRDGIVLDQGLTVIPQLNGPCIKGGVIIME
jgi:hypothetical protein